MPHWLRLGRGRVQRYDVSSKNSHLVTVHMLNSHLIECTLSIESSGQECLENIAARFQINDVSIYLYILLQKDSQVYLY